MPVLPNSHLSFLTHSICEYIHHLDCSCPFSALLLWKWNFCISVLVPVPVICVWLTYDPPQMSGFKTIYCFSHGSVGWLGSARHFSPGCLVWLKSDVGWSHSHLRSWWAGYPRWHTWVAGHWCGLLAGSSAGVWPKHLHMTPPCGLATNSPTLGSERQHAKSKYSKWWTLKLLK